QNNVQNLERLVRGMNRETTRIEIQYADGRRRLFTRAEAERELESTRQKLRMLDEQRVGLTERINRTAIRHEIAHQVLYNAGVRAREAPNPKWRIEGMACLFEETPPDSAGSGIHAINQLRVRDLRNALMGDPDREQ